MRIRRAIESTETTEINSEYKTAESIGFRMFGSTTFPLPPLVRAREQKVLNKQSELKREREGEMDEINVQTHEE